MAVKTTRVTVGHVAAVVIANGNDLDGISGIAHNLTATAVIYVGGPDVDVSTKGFPWDQTTGDLPFDLKSGEMLYGITKAADPDQDVAVLANTQ